jgi:hypothetical protein
MSAKRKDKSKTVTVDRLPTMTPQEREEFLELIRLETEDNDGKQMAVFPDFADCLLYYTYDECDNPCAVYCYEDLVESFARKNHTTYIEAVEFIDYNTMRTIPYMTQVGDTPTTAPIIIHRINRNFTTLEPSYFAKTYSDDPEPESK